MATSVRKIENLNILTDNICLNFINTAGQHLSDTPREWLGNYKDIVNWSLRVNILDKEKASKLLVLSELSPELAEEVYKEAIELREAIYRILLSHITQKPYSKDDMSLFNACLKRANQYLILDKSTSSENFTLKFEDALELDWMLWEVIKATGGLLTSTDLTKLRLCEDDECGWLFLDFTKNHSKKWCSMEECGNKAKAKRHYSRKRKIKESGDGSESH